jgi:hypothetical protein
MKSRILLFAVSGAAFVAVGVIASGCFQELDPGAASGGPLASPEGGDDAESPDGYSSWEICQSPSCDSPDGDIPFLAQTPPIYLPDGGVTTDPCVEVEQASMAVRQTYCAGCHQAPANQGGLSFVLNDGQLTSAVSPTATDDAGAPQKLVVAGDPVHSALYVSVAQGLGGSQTGMPPLTLAGYPDIPRPTASDVSLLYAWILACFPGAGGYVTGGVDYAPADDAGAP